MNRCGHGWNPRFVVSGLALRADEDTSSQKNSTSSQARLAEFFGLLGALLSSGSHWFPSNAGNFKGLMGYFSKTILLSSSLYAWYLI